MMMLCSNPPPHSSLRHAHTPGDCLVRDTIVPLQSDDSHKYVDLLDKVNSALCGVGRVNFHVCGGYCTCAWRAVYCTCVCLHACTYVYVLLLYTYLQY